ncbi:hypothetical protein TNCV_3756591 [Trichonephila clavipes]|nr:hypothetical protein TNCV_3756591 [Trichonephila clavipes]
MKKKEKEKEKWSYQLVALPLGTSRCLAIVQHDDLSGGKFHLQLCCRLRWETSRRDELGVVDQSLGHPDLPILEPQLLFMGTSEESCFCDFTRLRRGSHCLNIRSCCKCA